MAAKQVTEQMLRAYLEQKTKSTAARRIADAEYAALQPMATELEQLVEAAPDQRVKRGNHGACFEDAAVQVAWKDEFVRVAGARAAVQLQQQRATKKRLVVSSI